MRLMGWTFGSYGLGASLQCVCVWVWVWVWVCVCCFPGGCRVRVVGGARDSPGLRS